jgi:hypothetical protein
MNVFNRLFTVAGMILLLAAGLLALLSPATAIAIPQTIADSIRTNFFGTMTDTARFGVRLLAAVIFALIMAGVLWLELRRPVQRTIEVGRESGASTTIRISTDAVESKVRDKVDNLDGVIGSKVRAVTRNKGVDVSIDVRATKDTDLVAKAEEVSALTRMIVQDELGLKLHGKPQVTITPTAGKARVARKPLFPGGKAQPAETPQRPALEPAPASAAVLDDEPLVADAPALPDEPERKRSDLFSRHMSDPKLADSDG